MTVKILKTKIKNMKLKCGSGEKHGLCGSDRKMMRLPSSPLQRILDADVRIRIIGSTNQFVNIIVLAQDKWNFRDTEQKENEYVNVFKIVFYQLLRFVRYFFYNLRRKNAGRFRSKNEN